MIQSIYLHREIVDVLRCYGTLDEVVNRILQEGAEGKFDLMYKPACPGREHAGRYDIDINEPNYLELLSQYGPYSSKISIRRLIYWFVENELYEEFEWEPINNFENSQSKLCKKKLNIALSELEKCKKYAPHSAIDAIDELCGGIIKLQEYLK